MKLWILLLAMISLGCDNARKETGGFTAVFKSIEDANEAHDRGTVELVLPGGNVSFQPRRVPSLFEDLKSHVEYIATIKLKRNWEIHDDDDFRALVIPNLKPNPLDISAIRLSGIRYVNRQVARSKDIASFYARISDCGTVDWSKKEIELLLPNGLELPPFPLDAQQHRVWLDWPYDKRQLFIEFEYDADKGEQLLLGCGLNYPD